jgi:hypothetical protein
MIQMVMKTKNWVSDIYWYSIIKNILSESKQYLFTIEIWEKMKDEYGYSYTIDRVEKELLNLQRTGYAVSIIKRGKQAWMYPTGEKLLALERKKTIDSVIADFISSFDRMPIEKELIKNLNESIDRKVVSERLAQIIKLTDSIDKIIKKSCNEKALRPGGKKQNSAGKDPTCEADKQEMPFYETIINDLDGTIQDIDFLTIIRIIDERKKTIIIK